MNYTLYTTVDVTHTKQYKNSSDHERLQWKEQNFNTVIQTLGLRANISYDSGPRLIHAQGTTYGFNTSQVIPIWEFTFSAPYRSVYEKNTDPIGLLLEDFDLVPFISGLDEPMTQNYNVFVTEGPNKNIVFLKKH